MLTQFKQHIQKTRLFSPNDKLLLAISGGVDSVVLAHLLGDINANFDLAHCNFKLRGADSDKDEAFCRNLAKTLKVECHVVQMPTNIYAKQQGLSLQMAARELRYAWFETLITMHGYDYLLTAHHADDSAETILLNLFRGSGIKGLTGIAEKRGHLVRPLLPFHKSEIITYAKTKGIKYRKDKSNDEDKYKRNLLRLKIVPLIKKINPSFESTLLKNAALLVKEQSIIEAYIAEKSKTLLKQKGKYLAIRITDLLGEQASEAILSSFLRPFGFNAVQIVKIFGLLGKKDNSGKKFSSTTHDLEITFGEIIIVEKNKTRSTKVYFKNFEDLLRSDLFELSEVSKIEKTRVNEMLIIKKDLIFPLCLRRKKTGDKFKPFGMQGFKLLSDFFKAQKLSTVERNEVLVLENGEKQIMWVPGYRSDERFRVSPQSKQIIKLKYIG